MVAQRGAESGGEAEAMTAEDHDQTLWNRSIELNQHLLMRDGNPVFKIYSALIRVKEESTSPILSDLLAALGWQGGTVHQALAEVRKLREWHDDYKMDSTAEGK